MDAAPDPFVPDGSAGMPAQPVRVEYEVATDDGFRNVVNGGSVIRLADDTRASYVVEDRKPGVQAG